MEQCTMKQAEREEYLIKTLKSKIAGEHDNAELCGIFIDSIMNGRDLQMQLINWLRNNPDSNAADVMIYWQSIRPERDEDFDYDTLPYCDDE